MEAFLVPLTAALAVSIPALATGWAQSRIGPAISASLAEKPELSTRPSCWSPFRRRWPSSGSSWRS